MRFAKFAHRHMSQLLLRTKLYLPATRSRVVTRPRLDALLAQVPEHKLTILSAPAGFGKTTLLAEWLNQGQYAAAWVSLDESDNEPLRFWTYVCAAFEALVPAGGESALALLQAPQPPDIPVALTVLLNTLATVSHPIMLVLDDYHDIRTRAIHTTLQFFLDHLAPNIHVILTTRSEPLLPLGQYRARHQLLEIRSSELRFTAEEATAFLKEVMHLELNASDIAALETRTEGWIAGLQLAALSMQGQQDLPSFIAAFTGSNRYIIGYLVEEVLERQTETIQQFLLQTALLERLSAALCNMVTQRGDSDAVLEQLERSNLFLIPLDDAQEWYRYHHLFAEVLQSRLRKTDPALIPPLHLRASDWFAQHGDVNGAIQHALAAHAWERAAALMRQYGEEFLKRSETTTLQEWFDALPDDILRAQPQLCLWYAELCGLTHRLAAAEQFLNDAERAVNAEATYSSAERARLVARVLYLRTGLALNAGDLPRTIALAQAALQHIAPDETEWRAKILLRLGTALLQSNNVADAANALDESARLASAQSDYLTATYALDNLASSHFLQGRLQQSAALLQQALRLFPEPAMVPITGLVRADLAEILYEWDDLAGAHAQLRLAVEAGTRGGLPRTLSSAYTQLACVLLAEGNRKGARDAFMQAQQLIDQYRLPLFFSGPNTAFQVRLWLTDGDVRAAEEWANASGLRVDDELSFLQEISHLTLVRVQIAQEKYEPALTLLKRLAHAAESAGRSGRLIEILALQALAHFARKENSAAFAALERALRLGEHAGYIRKFVDEGEPMRALLGEFRRLLVARPRDDLMRQLDAYISKLLAAFPTGVSIRVNTGLAEPLNERETTILHLMAEGHTNPEIADTLGIAVGTVKKYTNNIFGKLDASNRTQAVARARELGLL